eukprot:905557-Pelagomonas_calceolata.AAC.2
MSVIVQGRGHFLLGGVKLSLEAFVDVIWKQEEGEFGRSGAWPITLHWQIPISSVSGFLLG